MNQIESAGCTDIGKKRKINQDALFLDDHLGLYVVADGMGGHKAGEVASQIVVETLRDAMVNPEDPGEESRPDASLSFSAARLLKAIETANRNVRRASLINEACQGMGSTVSTILLSGRTVIAANVGDSPIYLIHRNKIEEISEPHTLAAEQAASNPEGDGQPDEAAHHILTRAVGAQDSVSSHICEIQGFPGDILVACSDGLSNKASKEEISNAARSMPPDEACRHLIALANERGGEDNITVLIARLKSAGLANSSVLKPVIRLFRCVFSGFRNKR
jgi:protein phosphatase